MVLHCVKKILIFFCVLVLLVYTNDTKTTLIWVRTQDHQTVTLEKWKIDEMTVLESLLSCQRNDNSKICPIRALMCTSYDLAIISHAFDVASKDMFKNLSDDDLHSLIDIAAQLEAIGMLVLCAKNNHYLYEPFFREILKKIKKYCNRVEYYSLGKSPINNVSALTCSPDGRTLIITGKSSFCAGSQCKNNTVIFDIETQAMLYYEHDEKKVVQFADSALSGDGNKNVSIYVDDENNSCITIRDVKNGKSKSIVIDDYIVGGPLCRPINIIIFNPLRTNEFFVECFGYLGKLVMRESYIEEKDFTDEQIKLLYQLYLSVTSGHATEALDFVYEKSCS